MNILIGVVVFLVLAAIAYIWLSYNSLVTLNERIKEAISGIDVQLKRRTDLIPNLVESVKGYAKHEKEVFENVTKARASMMKAEGPQEKGKASDMLTGALKSLFAVAEAYPNLQASDNFKELQEELSDTENKIQSARRFYNGNVRDFTTALQVFPGNIIGNMFHFVAPTYFDIPDDGVESKPVEVKF